MVWIQIQMMKINSKLNPKSTFKLVDLLSTIRLKVHTGEMGTGFGCACIVLSFSFTLSDAFVGSLLIHLIFDSKLYSIFASSHRTTGWLQNFVKICYVLRILQLNTYYFSTYTIYNYTINAILLHFISFGYNSRFFRKK